MKYVGVKTTGELRLHEVKEPQTDEIYMAVEDSKLGAVPIHPYEFVKWDGKQWVKVPNVQLVTTLDTSEIDNEIFEINKEQSYIKRLLTNPLGLPANTIRCKFTTGYTPTMGTSQTLVDSDNNVWDIVFDSAVALFYGEYNLKEVLGANTFGVTSMSAMFCNCDNLEKVALFDTSSVTDMSSMFAQCCEIKSVPLFDTSFVTNFGVNESYTIFSGTFGECSSLIYVPLLDTSSAIDMTCMFNQCEAVASGALALYQQASAQNPQPSHTNTFKNCGVNTTTGAAELTQIPASWGGTKSVTYTGSIG